MYVDKVKYTAQYDEYGIVKHKWVGIDVALNEGDDPEKAFQLAQEMTEHFHKKANNPHLGGTTVADVPVTKVSFAIDEETQYKIDQEFAQAVDALSKIEFQEDALKWMNNNGWTYNVELKKIANNKPKKQ